MRNAFPVRFELALAVFLVSSGGGLALTGGAALAQLIDPNRNCVYQPGSTTCEPIRKPTAPEVSGPPYSQFLSLVSASGININLHGTYTEAYFNQRAQAYCGLLAQGELMKVVQEIQFPPVVHWTETTTDRPRLETAILRIGAMNYCRQYFSQEQQIEGTIMR